MTQDEREQLAAEAIKIRENDAVMTALRGMRMAALEELAAIDAIDADGIRERQATVRVVDEFFGKLEAFIRDGKPKNPAGIV